MMNICRIKMFLVSALAASLFCVGGVWAAVSAQTGTVPPGAAVIASPAPAVDAALADGQIPSFVYNRERPDPFFPFLTQEIMKAEAKAKAELTGTRKFEPAQLTLVAIVSGRRGFLAMVQDSAGIGYVLRKGTKIGEAGEVIQIAKDKVVIEQGKKVMGERTSRKVELILNKEGEK